MKKKSFYLFAMMMVAMLCVGFTSCGDDDDDGPGSDGPGSGNASALVGTWQWSYVEYYYSDGTVNAYSTLEEGVDYFLYFHFNGDKTGKLYTRIKWEDTWRIKSLEYNINGETLTITTDSHMYGGDYKIISLTDSELKFEHADHSRIDTFKKVSDSVIAGAEE